ncbi:hypothetical protein BM221_004149 [Beauveria bassiana]|uniref:Major facilitator superfamily transporter n=1 Tax=Beauveria bassiana TaxID=176275 RepID=A0A2N6NQG2_BEABA|nr:hypothetical protein BM221_004149 [Beauveria bassiana]
MASDGNRSDEQRPLLHEGASSVGGDAALPKTTTTTQPTASSSSSSSSSSSRRGLIVSSLLILLTSNLTAILVDTASNQLIEGAACKQLHPEVTDWYEDTVCKKSLDVQDRLALIAGWEYSWSLVPGLLLAIPYGVFMDRYGPRAMLILVALGGVITQTLYLVVTQYPELFDLRMLWGCVFIGSVIGGGNIGWQAVVYTVCNMIASKDNRAEILFYVSSITTLNMLFGGFLVYWAMNIGPVFAQSLGCVIFVVELALSFTLPGGLASGEPVTQTDSNASAWQAIVHGLSGTKEGVMGFGKLFSQNRQLGLLLISLVISTIGIRQSGIRQQYATHRYGWSWAKTRSAMGKDLVIARAGILSLAFGSLFVGLARTSEQFIAALVFYMTESCYMPAIISTIAAMAGVDNIQADRTGSLYMAVVFMNNAGAIVAGPIISSLLRVGMSLGGDWVGLPFFVEAAIQIVTICIVFSIRESHYKRLQPQEDGQDSTSAASA